MTHDADCDSVIGKPCDCGGYEMSDNDKCKIHGCDLECMGGRSAHISNWYCPVCHQIENDVVVVTDKQSTTAGLIKRLEDLAGFLPVKHISNESVLLAIAALSRLEAMENGLRQLEDLAKRQKDLPPDFEKILRDNYWELLP